MTGRGRPARLTVARRPRLLQHHHMLATVILAVLAYVPALCSSPGMMPADTKLGLYLDPGRLIRRARLVWDPQLFGGWVPHQMVAYLWPSGPWFWLARQLGLPVWVAHRLWIGTLLFAAGTGVLWLARRLGLTVWPAFAAAVVYQCSPYVLAYISRTSAMLLPWAAVGWITGLALRAARLGGWWSPAAAGLVVASVGAVNPTALMMVTPAPALMLVTLAWQGSVAWRRAAAAAARLVVVGAAVSLWWVAMVIIQRRFGADVLAYSETVRDVSSTATSTEALRGLGYWLFYMGDHTARTTTAAVPYLTSPVLIAAGWLLVVGALAALATIRWAHRSFAALCIATGVVLAVGPYPFGRSAVLWRLLGGGSVAAAIRSSTRAVPVVVLGISLALAAGASALSTRRPRRRAVLAGAVAALAVLNLPSLWQARLVDPSLRRSQDVPAAWREAARFVDRGDPSSAVLLLPGQEFGAFSWGYTVDPPLGSLISRPLLTRDLLPLGTAPTMDLLYALDDRVQEGTFEVASLAPVARLLGAGTVWLAQDEDATRFRTGRPVVLRDLLDRDGVGLVEVRDVGAPVMPPAGPVEESTLLHADRPLSPVALVDVATTGGNSQPNGAVTEPRAVLLAGSGDGVVDAAAAGLLDGTEALYYAAADDHSAPAAQLVILTDSNRDRAHHWRGSQDVHGYTSGPGLDPLVTDTADARLPVFPMGSEAHRTTATLGQVKVRATGYGEPFAYLPEHRPAMAVDGDPDTAWIVGERGDPLGQSLVVDGTDAPLVLRQAHVAGSNRRIAEVRVEWTEPTRGETTVVLDGRADTVAGQPVDVGTGRRTITITRVEPRPGGTDSGPSGVGLAEIGPVAGETIVLPTVTAAQAPPSVPLAVVLTRLRLDPADRWRSDPEPLLSRSFTLPSARTLAAHVTVRLSRRAADEVLRQWVPGAPATASSRMAGSLAGGWVALDGRRETAWITPFGRAVGATLQIDTAGGPVDSITVTQPAGEMYSTITELTITAAGEDQRVSVPAPDSAGRSVIPLRHQLAAGQARITISAVAARTTVDRRYGETVTLPAAIAEIEGLTPARRPAPAMAGCRTDLLTVDGQPFGLQISGNDAASLAAGSAVTVAACQSAPIDLAAGAHDIRSASGLRTGVDVDRVILTSDAASAGDAAGDAADAAGGSSPSAAPGAPAESAARRAPWQRPAGPGPAVQRAADAALVLSGLAVIACLVVVVAGRRRATLTVNNPDQLASRSEPAAPTLDRTSWLAVLRRVDAGIAASVLAGLAVLLATPTAALICVGLAAVVAASRRPGMLWPMALVAATLQGAGMIATQLRHHPRPDGLWPHAMARWHHLGLVAVLSVAAAALAPVVSDAGAAWRRRRRRPSG